MFPGITADGGFAEYLRTSERSLVKIHNLDPEDVAPLADAGLTAIRAVKKVASRTTSGSNVVVMGVAHPATIKGAVRAGRDYGIQVMGDIMVAPDKPACARRMQELGVDYIIVHTGFDERHEEIGKSPLDDLEAVRRAVTIPIQAVGGLSVEQAIRMPELGAPLVVIGAPLVIDDREFKPGDADNALEALLRHIVTEVKRGMRHEESGAKR